MVIRQTPVSVHLQNNTMSIDIERDFLAIRDKLKSYLYRLTTNNQDVEDLLQDTYIRVKEKCHTFKGDSSFKTWVFSIATNLAKDNRRVKTRWELEVQDQCKNAALTNKSFQNRIVSTFQSITDRQFEIAEHINFCFTCIAKNLPLDKQIGIILKEFYQFKRTEISKILNITEGALKHLLHESRTELQSKYNHRCALINKQGVCCQCAELNDFLQDGKNSKEKISLLGLSTCNSAKTNLDKRFALISQINPINSKGAKLEDTILQILKETINDQ